MMTKWYRRYTALRNYARHLGIPTYWWEFNDELAMRIADAIRDQQLSAARQKRVRLDFTGRAR